MSTATSEHGEDSLVERQNTVVPEPEGDQDPPKDLIPAVNGAEEPDEEESEDSGPELPIYCSDDQPEKEGDWIKWALLHGYTEEQLVVDEKKNGTTVRIMALELEKEGLRQRPVKMTKAKTTALIKAAKGDVAKKGVSSPKIFAHGQPPESILDGMNMPDGVDGLDQFAMGMKYGAKMVMVGVRIAQELSTIGVQQARPLIELAREQRAGEEAAAERASIEAANEAADRAANRVMGEVAPYLAKIKELSDKPRSDDPMKQIMAETMGPIMKRLISGLLPGMAGEESDAPSGWTKE